MRLFLAVFPPPAAREAAHAAADALRRAGPARASVSWVKAENLHDTLAFLGEVGEDGARRATEAAMVAAASVPAFDARFGGLGAFPNPGRARVLWVGMSAGAEALTALAHALDRALRSRGFGAPDHPFSPHLTLGRVREAGGDWSEALRAAPAPGGPEAGFAVERLCVGREQALAQGLDLHRAGGGPARGSHVPGGTVKAAARGHETPASGSLKPPLPFHCPNV